MEDDYCKKDILTEVAISAVEGLHYAEDRLRSLAFQVEFGKQPTEKDQEILKKLAYKKILREKLGVTI
jgi:hypothetical protein